MRKILFSLATVICIMLSKPADAQTQTGANYFAGKWSVMVRGLPMGDTRLILSLDKKDSTLTGVVQDSTGKEITKITNMEVKEKQAIAYFHAQGYDVTLTMDKKDEDHVTGNMMNMFDAEGERIKDSNPK